MHWIANVKGGPRRVNHAAVVVNDLIFSFGGYCSSEDYRSLYTIDVQVLNTHTLRWSKVKPHPLERGRIYPEVPFKRYGHTAVLYKHLVYIWGGRNDEMCCNVLFAFDTRTLRWVKPTVNGRVPGVRDGHSACVVGHCMYVFGGFEEEINQFSRDVHCLNLETMTWSFVETCGEPPSYRDFHTATVLNDRMYVFGGRGDWNSPYHTQDEFYCERIVYLDLKTSMWHMPKTTGQVPVGRRSHSAIVYNGKLIVFGGYHSVLDLHFNDVNSFDPATNCWSLLSTRGREPRPRRRQVCLMVGDRMFMFGGTSPYVVSNPKYQHVPCMIKLWDYNDLHVLDFKPTLQTLAMMTVLKSKLDISCLPANINRDIQSITVPNKISKAPNFNG